ncbi:butyryl-CoA:acetate CoA-transferase domain protein [delta proteobacterium NaphS2]|nr:butyryl-CoA:acetate CoA-transferase domain protein [delta proteobacterium NaphS2]
MISVNSVLEVDLFGQANAEFMEGHQFSGTGGQLDFREELLRAAEEMYIT